jgi:hypothetical protein
VGQEAGQEEAGHLALSHVEVELEVLDMRGRNAAAGERFSL